MCGGIFRGTQVQSVWSPKAIGSVDLGVPGISFQLRGPEDDLACVLSSPREADSADGQCGHEGRGNDPDVGSRRVGADEVECCEWVRERGQEAGCDGGKVWWVRSDDKRDVRRRLSV